MDMRTHGGQGGATPENFERVRFQLSFVLFFVLFLFF